LRGEGVTDVGLDAIEEEKEMMTSYNHRATPSIKECVYE
jgi:hypothetical protein